MLNARHFKWLPNALTFTRFLLAVPIFFAALSEEWTLGFWLLVIALLTDFFDGLAAKKLHAQTSLGKELDGWADSSLVVAGMTGLSAGGHLSWWFTLFVFAVGAVVGSDRVFRNQRSKRPVARMVASITCLLVGWITIAWSYAALAFGWSWFYVPLTFLALLVLASLKRHRLRAWLGITGKKTT